MQGSQVIDVAELTGFPEMMDGRVKTLHPKVHGGLLAIRGNKEHAAAMKAPHQADRSAGREPLSVRGNRRQGRGLRDCIENIDIGGPAMIRAAAKNHDDVTVVVDASDYEKVLGEMAQHNGDEYYRVAPKAGRQRPMRELLPMMRRFPTGSPKR